MLWVALSLFSAFATAAYQIYSKKLLKEYSNIVLIFCSFLFGAFLFAPFPALYGIPNIDALFWISLVMFSALFFTTSYLILASLKLSPISEVLPILSATPLFTIALSFIMLRQLPTIYGAAGILLTVIGYYLLSIDTLKFGLFAPIKSPFVKKGAFLMLLASFLLSILANLYKIGIEHSNEFFFLTLGYLLTAAVSFAIMVFQKNAWRAQAGKPRINRHLILIGILWGLIDIFYVFAIKYAIVPYVVSIKRLSVLFGVFSGIIVFREKNFTMKMLGTAIMLAGAFIIIMD